MNRIGKTPVAKERDDDHPALVLMERKRQVVALVTVMSIGLFFYLVMMTFGVNTSCTDSWSCSSSYCSPCRIVAVATYGGFAVGLALGVAALVSPWPRRGRSAIYVGAMVATALLATLVALTWQGAASP